MTRTVSKTLIGRARGRRGSIMLLGAVTMVVVVGFAGLAVDVGLLETRKRNTQSAADAAVVAAAVSKRRGGDYVRAARDLASLNGYTDDVSGVSVSVNNPPTSGPYTSNFAFFEVIIAKSEPTYFIRMLGPGSMMVKARAVARDVNSQFCIHALDPLLPSAINTNSGNSLTTDCGIVSNSSSPLAITSSGSITAPVLGVVGGYTGTINGPITTGIAPEPDPLAYVPPPPVGACDYSNVSVTSGAVVLAPGTYCGSNGLAAINVSANAQVTFSPGTYVLNGGGMAAGGNSTLTGSGVTFYNTGTATTYSPINIQDQSALYLKAPTSGPLAGILFFSDRSITFPTQPNTVGMGTGYVEGSLYFPTTDLFITTGSNSGAKYTIVVAKTLNLSINTFTLKNDYSSLTGGSPLKRTVLYE